MFTEFGRKWNSIKGCWNFLEGGQASHTMKQQELLLAFSRLRRYSSNSFNYTRSTNDNMRLMRSNSFNYLRSTDDNRCLMGFN